LPAIDGSQAYLLLLAANPAFQALFVPFFATVKPLNPAFNPTDKVIPFS
jgi:hypothetical protein